MLSSFTSKTVFQQLTGCKFYGSATDAINFVVFFDTLTGGVKNYVMLCEESDFIHFNNLPAKETPVSSKRTKTNPGNDTRKIIRRPSCFKCITADRNNTFPS